MKMDIEGNSAMQVEHKKQHLNKERQSHGCVIAVLRQRRFKESQHIHETVDAEKEEHRHVLRIAEMYKLAILEAGEKLGHDAQAAKEDLQKAFQWEAAARTRRKGGLAKRFS